MADTIKVTIECKARVEYSKTLDISVAEYESYQRLCVIGDYHALNKWCVNFAGLYIDPVTDVSLEGEFEDVEISPVPIK